ncbi:hypothetical protein NX059_005041 [Plenodomus lindquistii]|nr:hypothetical protein NX059_005041 [Plenodomus lindquistii]
MLAEQKEMEDLAQTLESLVIPATCQEVNLEVETREDLLNNWTSQQEQMEACRQISLKRSDGSFLRIDDRFALEYSWDGSGQARWSTSENTSSKSSMNYRAVRLCWRARVPRRDYMGYDHNDCMDVTNDPKVKERGEDETGRR